MFSLLKFRFLWKYIQNNSFLPHFTIEILIFFINSFQLTTSFIILVSNLFQSKTQRLNFFFIFLTSVNRLELIHTWKNNQLFLFTFKFDWKVRKVQPEAARLLVLIYRSLQNIYPTGFCPYYKDPITARTLIEEMQVVLLKGESFDLFQTKKSE